MRIFNFEEFVNESYLKGSRAPIYHYTRRYAFSKILDSDTLKLGRPSREIRNNGKATALTRNPYYTHDGASLNSPRFVLDLDKLKNDGIRSYPVDEIGIAMKQGGMTNKNFSKSNFDEVKSGKRGTAHGLDLPETPALETEFEERIYKDVPNLSKYIISIDLATEPDNSLKQELKKYLQKYPHIVINLYDTKKRHQVTDITKQILEEEKVKV